MKKWMTVLVLLVTLAAVNAAPVRPKVFVSHFENVLGTSLEVKVAATSEKVADAAENAALTEIARLNAILSAYDPKSEFSRWMKTRDQAVPVSAELFEVLSLFDQWKTKSGGSLSAAAETINALWKRAAKLGQAPSRAAIASAVTAASQPQWSLDALHQTATHLSDAPLALNSFTKSYIIKRAADAAMAAGGAAGVAINIGGDIVIRGKLVEPVMITDPRANAENDAPLTGIRISNKAIATSGDYRRGVQIAGNWYSHIVDPRTGIPASEVVSATVVAPEATDAGALATAFNVLKPGESQALAATIPGVEYLIVTKDGKQIASAGWKAMELPHPGNTHKEPTADWNDEYELAINFEIALIEGMRVRRPFVAVWIEDAKGVPVRNISVWYNRERWLPDLKNWYRNYAQAFNAEAGTLKTSVSSATRSPGKYTLKWDGKDDKGEVVAPGKYTVLIEAAREHGTYQLMRQEIEIKKKPTVQTYNLPGNVEIAAASIELRKRSGK